MTSLDWPAGRKIMVSEHDELFVLTNINNHLAICCSINGENIISRTSNFISAVDMILSNSEIMENIVVHPKYGFLTSIPSEIANSFSMKILMNIPEVKSTGNYSSLADPFKVNLGLKEDLIALTHKYKFLSFQTTITELLQVGYCLSEKEKELRNQKDNLQKKDQLSEKKEDNIINDEEKLDDSKEKIEEIYQEKIEPNQDTEKKEESQGSLKESKEKVD